MGLSPRVVRTWAAVGGGGGVAVGRAAAVRALARQSEEMQALNGPAVPFQRTLGKQTLGETS